MIHRVARAFLTIATSLMLRLHLEEVLPIAFRRTARPGELGRDGRPRVIV